MSRAYFKGMPQGEGADEVEKLDASLSGSAECEGNSALSAQDRAMDENDAEGGPSPEGIGMTKMFFGGDGVRLFR